MDSRWSIALKPISGDSPCGEDLCFSPEFDKIQELRREDDATADYGEWRAPLKTADWPAVIACCEALFNTRSKDLRLAGWLTEALTKLHGMGGLADGVELITHLISNFGNDLHPQSRDGDQEQQVGCMSWFSLRMSHLVRQIPLTEGGEYQFSLNDYESALQLQARMPRESSAVSEADMQTTLEQIAAAAGKTDKSLYVQWIADAERCRKVLGKLVEESDSLFGADGPSFSPLLENIGAVIDRLSSTATGLGMNGVVMETGACATDLQGAGASQRTHAPRDNHPFGNRGEALETLGKVAVFFRETEPHSPVAYLADKACRWANMPLHVWLRSVVKDDGTFLHLGELLGLQPEAVKRGDEP